MHFERQSIDLDAKISAIVGLVTGLIFVVAGAWVYQKDTQERSQWRETHGTVVDGVSRKERDYEDDRDKVTYAPVIEFEANGDRVRFTGKYDDYRPSDGHVVVVRYDPNQPTTARVVDPLEWLTFWWVMGMGGTLTYTSLVSLSPVRLRFSRQQQP